MRETHFHTPHQLMGWFRPGEPHDWETELNWIWSRDRAHTLKLMDRILLVGSIQVPVLLGPDRRVWDGHHRIAIALALDLKIPVQFAPYEKKNI